MANTFRYPCTNSSPAVQQIIKVIDAQPMSLDALVAHLGSSHVNVWKWRVGIATPNLANAERILHKLGYELKVVKREDDPDR